MLVLCTTTSLHWILIKIKSMLISAVLILITKHQATIKKITYSINIFFLNNSLSDLVIS